MQEEGIIPHSNTKEETQASITKQMNKVLQPLTL
jgi:hypothetical protein